MRSKANLCFYASLLFVDSFTQASIVGTIDPGVSFYVSKAIDSTDASKISDILRSNGMKDIITDEGDTTIQAAQIECVSSNTNTATVRCRIYTSDTEVSVALDQAQILQEVLLRRGVKFNNGGKIGHLKWLSAKNSSNFSTRWCS